MNKSQPSKNKAAGWLLKGYAELPVELSKWEQFLASENIAEQDALKPNSKVFEFVRRNYRFYFVPEKVLKMYRMDLMDA